METLLNILAGILGIILYQLVKSKDYIISDSFSLEVSINQNLKIWLWAMMVTVIAGLIFAIEPKATGIIHTMVGLDLGGSRGSWILFGTGLCGLIRNTRG